MKGKILALCLLLAAAAAALCLLLFRPAPRQVSVLVDGAPLAGSVLAPEAREDLRVHVTLDGAEIADLPFGQAHTVRILQGDGAENTLLLTGDSVLMQSANCEGQDCVHMEKITRENLETRVRCGMIICLPHRLSVEVREQ